MEQNKKTNEESVEEGMSASATLDGNFRMPRIIACPRPYDATSFNMNANVLRMAVYLCKIVEN